MGWKAVEFFNQFKIKLVVGVSGKVDDIVDQLLKGKIKRGENICEPGEGKGYGLKKEDGHNE